MHLTKDGVLVLMHDQTVDRTTDGHGAIRDLTLAEIKQLDAAYNFTQITARPFPIAAKASVCRCWRNSFNYFPISASASRSNRPSRLKPLSVSAR